MIFGVSYYACLVWNLSSYKAVTCRLSKWLVSQNQPTTLVTILVTRMFVIMLVTSVVFTCFSSAHMLGDAVGLIVDATLGKTSGRPA